MSKHPIRNSLAVILPTLVFFLSGGELKGSVGVFLCAYVAAGVPLWCSKGNSELTAEDGLLSPLAFMTLGMLAASVLSPAF
jgi:hypothetical protein